MIEIFIKGCIQVLDKANTSWCKLNIKDIKEAHIYASSKGIKDITFKFDSDDVSRGMITMVLKK
jgi:hypothetical protein